MPQSTENEGWSYPHEPKWYIEHGVSSVRMLTEDELVLGRGKTSDEHLRAMLEKWHFACEEFYPVLVGAAAQRLIDAGETCTVLRECVIVNIEVLLENREPRDSEYASFGIRKPKENLQLLNFLEESSQYALSILLTILSLS